MLNYHRERFRKLTFRALALRQSDLPQRRSTTVSLETREDVHSAEVVKVHIFRRETGKHQNASNSKSAETPF